MPKVGLILLAAGASTRMGQPKQLLPYLDTTLIGHVVGVALESSCKPINVVLGAYASQVRPELEQLSVNVTENPNWDRGVGTSISCGISEILNSESDLDAVVIALADMPLIDSKHIDNLISLYNQKPKPLIVASSYGTLPGVPALFDSSMLSELANLQGSAGAKVLVRKYADISRLVPLGKNALDIDTPYDYAELTFLTDLVKPRGSTG